MLGRSIVSYSRSSALRGVRRGAHHAPQGTSFEPPAIAASGPRVRLGQFRLPESGELALELFSHRLRRRQGSTSLGQLRLRSPCPIRFGGGVGVSRRHRLANCELRGLAVPAMKIQQLLFGGVNEHRTSREF